jgi:hypothetical protein
MTLRSMLVLVLMAAPGMATADEQVGVPGTGTQYTTPIDATVAARPVKLVLTGTALRQKYFFNVYSIGSYLEEGAEVHSPEELAEVDRPKRLHLVMERTVDGKAMADAFRAAIRMNYPEPAFEEEVERLAQMLRNDTARKGDHIHLTHVPGMGLQVSLAGKIDFLIKNPRFSRAIWDIYLGKQNLGEHIKHGLVSRL